MSMMETGANKRKKDKIYSKPQSKKTKLAMTAKTKAVTWFLVKADMVCETESMQPAMRKLPM